MRLNKIESNRYDINLEFPFKNSQTEYKSRTGYIIKLYVDGLCGFGEAAPLAPYSKESFNQIVWAFEELKSALCCNHNYTKNDLLGLFALYANGLPSLNFALDIALYDVLSQKQNISIAKYLNKNCLETVKFSSTYNGNMNNGFKTIKIKFGINNIDDEINCLQNLYKQYNSQVQFRIDANRAYSIDDFLYLKDKLTNYNIQYIEEPLSELNITSLEKIKKILPIPIAIDESIFTDGYQKLVESGMIDYVILKASLYGSIKNIFILCRYLNKYKVKIILSSGLHTKIGNLSNIHLAAALNLSGDHGLNNYPFFEYNYKKMPYNSNDNSIMLKNINGLGVSWDD